ncbi:DEAD/DEAH box helicase [Kocuria sp. CPCC 205300]|uniref:DEAD/DEAH box helicase n=1 Tax=Kocuria sabuli TaxID=3071448 RepID=UPI0036D9B451
MDPAAHDLDTPRRIVQAWEAIELFSPPTVEKVTRGASDEPVTTWQAGHPLPWEPDGLLGRRPLKEGRMWQCTIYLGVYGLQDIYRFLDRVFEPDREAYDRRRGGDSALAAVTVDGAGIPVPGSVVLSGCAWATGQCATARYGSAGRDLAPTWTAGFTAAQENFRSAIDDALNEAGHGSTEQPLTSTVVLSLRGLARSMTSMAATDIEASEIRIRCRQVPEKAASTASDFLNSFLLEDLHRVGDAVAGGDVGPALRTYLDADGRNPAQAVDTRTEPHRAAEEVRPHALPAGRWPSNPDQNLALSQQLAVNLALNSLGSRRGLLAVNGPPGTGKTTLLRDVLAGLVVERAKRLADLEHPGHAFVATHRWKSGDYPRTTHVLRPELTGFEMVVASSNNTAVQNISDELPSRGSIKKPWHNTANYFGGLASDIQAATAGKGSADQAWGLVAARLGNAQNCGAFVQAAWWGRQNRDGTRNPGLRSILTEGQVTDPDYVLHPRPWPEAVCGFRNAVEAVQQLTKECLQAEKNLSEEAHLGRRVRNHPSVIASLRDRLDSAVLACSLAAETALQLHDVRRTALRRRRDHRGARPDLRKIVTTWGRALKQWRKQDAQLAADVETHSRRLEEAFAARRQREEERSTAQRALEGCRMQHKKDCRRLAELEPVLAQYRRRWGEAFPDAAWMADENRREIHSPWASPELNGARSALFLEALRLHQDFIGHTRSQMHQSLFGAFDIVSGRAPKDLAPEIALAAWQSFFLVVPLVSTTFSSLGRLFSHLGRESLGWLLLDEAGQAAPQQAVGGMWRTQRAVVVGDPLQLTPVLTLPAKAQHDIMHEFRAPDGFVPATTSAQELADRQTAWGTTLGSETEARWVGVPLRVHRRCDDPMFTICNRIAYDDMMISAKLQEEEPSGLPTSRWIDVPAGAAEGHLIREEITEAKEMIDDLVCHWDVPADQIIAVSPFRDTARELERLATVHRTGLRAGTVHTAQGQEATVVVLVLGGDPARPGALGWATETPNLLNVAVSRAQQRLYVIGNRRVWSSLPVADVLAEQLRHTRRQA